MKILVAGANGQVGWELGQQGAESAHDVITLGRDQLDICDAESVKLRVQENQPEIVINAAAYTAVDKAEEERDAAFAINRDGAKNLAQACKDVSIPLLHISTDYVFDGTKDNPYLESDPVAPLGVYGESKWAGEVAVKDTLDRCFILRTSWVFGIHGHNFVKTILRVAGERDELRVVSDQLGSPTSAHGIASALLQICDHYSSNEVLPWGTYHYTGQPFTSWHGFAEAIVKLGRENGLIDHEVMIHPISTEEYPTPAKRPANSRLSSELIQSKLRIKPDDWQAALQSMIVTMARQDS
ncbi:MAG: dTDP-4-dehydrorhamnose reductase [Gammaproteobacteria bacterium]|nr:MAG: dTDP-4-dehydrorhamnose reductase [Gammaproteobacteria bacterium]